MQVFQALAAETGRFEQQQPAAVNAHIAHVEALLAQPRYVRIPDWNSVFFIKLAAAAAGTAVPSMSWQQRHTPQLRVVLHGQPDVRRQAMVLSLERAHAVSDGCAGSCKTGVGERFEPKT